MKAFDIRNFILTSVLCLPQLTLAAQGVGWQEALNQDSWKSTTLQSLDHPGTFLKAWQVKDSEYRLEELPSAVSGSLELESDNNFNNTGFRRWKKECRNVDDYTPYLIIESNHFEVNLNLKTVTFEKDEWVPRENTWKKPIISNKPVLKGLEISVQLKPGAVTEKVSGQLVASANRHLNQQLAQVKVKEGVTAKLELDLSSMDAIACDLANEKARLVIRGYYDYSSAKAVPNSPLTGKQILEAQKKAMKDAHVGEDVVSRISGSIVSLTYALEEHQAWHPKSAVRAWVAGLSEGLVDFSTGRWKTPGDQELKYLWGKIATWNYNTYDGVIDYEFLGGE